MEEVRGDNRLDDEAVRLAAKVFSEYGGFIRAVIHFQAHSRLDEEDLFQEFFLTLLRNPMPADVQNIKSYLYRAITNHVLDALRMRESYQRNVKKYVRETRISINIHPSTNAFIEETEEKNTTIAYLARYLHERQAQAFLLRYRDNFGLGEIAGKMGVSTRTVSRYLSGAIERLRKTFVIR